METSVLLSGLVYGLMYAAAGMGLVIVYRANRVINFALGGMGAIAGYLAFAMVQRSVPFWIAVVVSVAAGAAVGSVVYLIVRPLLGRGDLTVVVATLGVLVCIQGIVGSIWGFNLQSVRAPLTDSSDNISIAGASISGYSLIVVAIILVSILAVYAVFFRTTLGLQMRATSAGPQTARLMGIDVERIRLFAWGLGGGYGALAAVLIIPFIHLSPFSFTGVTITAFAAIVIGGFGSFLGAVLGGVGLGLLTGIVGYSLTPSLTTTYTFVAIAAMLLLRPYGLFGSAERMVNEPDLHISALKKGEPA